MKRKITMLMSAVISVSVPAFAQWGVTNINGGATSSMLNNNNRIVHSPSPGSQNNQFGTWSIIGDPNNLNIGAQTPNNPNLYGFTSHLSGDRAFFGMRNTGNQNRADAVIAWGDDEAIPNAGPDKFFFEFHNSNAGAFTSITQAMALVPANSIGGAGSGVYVGIGTVNPTERLHTTSGVRFEGLTTGGVINNVVGIDANGKLWRTSLSGGISNSCSTVNFIPKVAASSGNLQCSQVFDNGTSVGINVTGGFGYTWSGGLTGPTLPPTAGTLKLAVNGVTRSLAYFATSDSTYKTNINPISNALNLVSALYGRTYNWKEEAVMQFGTDDGLQYGLIAQEVKEVLPEAVIVDEDGKYAVNYDAIIPVLIEGQKELLAMLQASQVQNKQLQQQLDALAHGTEESAASELYDNVPNPLSEETTINYNITKLEQSAGILITDMNGKRLRQMAVTQTGKGSVNFKREDMPPGIYLYSLVVDGKAIDTKRMVIE